MEQVLSLDTNKTGSNRNRRSRKRNRASQEPRKSKSTSKIDVDTLPSTLVERNGNRGWKGHQVLLLQRNGSKKRVTFQTEQVSKPDASESAAGDVPGSPAPAEEDEEEKAPPVMPLYQYSRDKLMLIKTYPLSQKRPDCLDSSFNSCLKMPVTSNSSRGVWDPERWHLDKRCSETPPDEVAQGNNAGDTHKRRSGDPRERIRKEQDGIVLSPQRRSFNSGCFVTQAQPPLVRRPESPIGKSDRDRDASHREIPTRRIGSGRILARERDSWDFRLDRDKDPESAADFNSFQRGSAGGGGREREAERFERRSFTRERDFGPGDKQPPPQRQGGGAGGGKWERRRYDSREEEPEWFSAGPTSQHDTIELRGFDESDEQPGGRPGGKKQPPGSFKASNGKTITRVSLGRKMEPPAASKAANNNTTANNNNNNNNPTAGKPSISPPAKEATPPRPPSASIRSPPERKPGTPPQPPGGRQQPSWPGGKDPSEEQLAADYNFLDDFLKGDALPHLLANGTEEENQSESRFSRYFHHDSPPLGSASRRSSLHDEMLKNMLNDFSEPSVVSSSEAYFAPISPAANSAAPQAAQPNTLLQMLHRGQGDGQKAAPSIKSLEGGGKIQSVEELEARMRQHGMGGKGQAAQPPKLPKKSEEDLAAFAKLMFNKSHGGGGDHGPLATDQAINLLAGFPASMHHQPPAQQQQQQQPNSQQMHVPQDLVLKLLHVQQQQQRQQQQQDMLNKLMASNQQQQQQQQKSSARLAPGPPFQAPPPSLSPLPFDLQQIIHGVQPSRELMQRPEAQAIMHGMQNGEISSQNVMQQLQNPAMQPRHREVLTHILKRYHSAQRQAGASPRTVSPHLAPPPQQQQQHPDMLQQMLLQQQTQQHTQQQLRIPSPLNSAYCAPPPPIISPNLGNNPNTLSVQHPVMPRRVPSPRELIVHTQNIMQSALIKKKLEEQRENFLKRQVQQSVSPNTMAIGGGMGNGPVKMGDAPPPQSKNVASPTPLTFTPTSVMRKMTAEKESEPTQIGMAAPRPDLKLQMNQQVFAMPPSAQQQQQQQRQAATAAQQLPLMAQLSRAQQQMQMQQAQQAQTGSSWIPPTAKLPAGRPIVKGTANFQPFSGTMDFPAPQQPLQPPHRSMHAGGGYAGAQSRSQMPMSNPPPPMGGAPPAGINPLMMMYRPQQQQQMNQTSNRGPSQKAQPHLVSMQQQQNMAPSLQQLLQGQQYGNTNRNSSNDPGMRHQSQPISMRQSQGGMMQSGGEVSTSPTSNQLAQWFSPELLAQAKAGRLAGMPAISTMQNMLSLEDLERLQQDAAAQLST